MTKIYHNQDKKLRESKIMEYYSNKKNVKPELKKKSKKKKTNTNKKNTTQSTKLSKKK